MTGFKTFRHAITGEVKTLPENYGVLFSDVLTEVDPSEERCLDCGVQPVEEEPEPVVEVAAFEEPEPRRKSIRRRDNTVE